MKGHGEASSGAASLVPRRRHRARFRVIQTGIVSAALLAGCWYPKERGGRLEQRVERIEDERPAGSAGKDTAALTEHARRVDASLADLRRRLEELSATPKAGTEVSAREREMTAELGRLREALEQYARRLEVVEKTLAQGPRGEGERIAQPRGTPEKLARREVPEVARQGTGSADRTAPGDKSGALAFAREQERKGEKTVARDLYQQYVTEFPTDPSTAEAHFRLGELAYGERRYRDAIVEYGKVASEFPRSSRAPDALLRTADSMLALGMKADAAILLSEVTERYPATPAAARAKRQLAELPKANAPASKQRD